MQQATGAAAYPRKREQIPGFFEKRTFAEIDSASLRGSSTRGAGHRPARFKWPPASASARVRRDSGRRVPRNPGLQSASWHAPQRDDLRIDLRSVRSMARRLPVGRTGGDEAVQRLQRAA